MKRLLFVSSFSVLFLLLVHTFLPIKSNAQTAPKIIAATGQAVSSGTFSVSTLATEAATEAKNSYITKGGTVPKIIILMQNTGDGNGAIIQAIKAQFGTAVPIVGVGTSWDDYTPYTLDSFPPSNTIKSISIMALGGTDISVTLAKADASYSSGGATQIRAAGHALAAALPLNTSEKNLLLLLGPMHAPAGGYVVDGIKEVYGTPLPAHIRLIGWASPDWGGQVYFQDSLSGGGTRAVGILIHGNYDWALSGIDHGEFGWGASQDPVTEISRQMNVIKATLGQNPDATFLVLGHPPRDQFPAIRSALATILGPTHALIGHHAGLEIGSDTTLADSVADGAHFFVAGIKAKSTTTPSPSPIPEDINRNGNIDADDIKLILSHWLGGGSCQSFMCDVSGDQKINVRDFASVVFRMF